MVDHVRGWAEWSSNTDIAEASSTSGRGAEPIPVEMVAGSVNRNEGTSFRVDKDDEDQAKCPCTSSRRRAEIEFFNDDHNVLIPEAVGGSTSSLALSFPLSCSCPVAPPAADSGSSEAFRR